MDVYDFVSSDEEMPEGCKDKDEGEKVEEEVISREEEEEMEEGGMGRIELTTGEFNSLYRKVPYNPDFQIPALDKFEVNPHNPNLWRLKPQPPPPKDPDFSYTPRRRIRVTRASDQEDTAAEVEASQVSDQEDTAGEVEASQVSDQEDTAAEVEASQVSDQEDTAGEVKASQVSDQEDTSEDEPLEDEEWRRVVEDMEAEDDPTFTPNPESGEVSSSEGEEEEDDTINSHVLKRKVAGRRKGDGPRTRTACSECGVEVVHLPRHLRIVHKRSRAEARVEARKNKSKLKDCPKCGKAVLRLDTHLVHAHKMARGREIHAVIMTAQSSQVTGRTTSKKPSTPETSAATSSRPNHSLEWDNLKHISAFKDWQMSLERNREARVADQHCQQVLNVWRHLDPTLAVASIVDMVRVRNQWFSWATNKYAPGTIRSYIGSLRDFYEYLMDVKELEIGLYTQVAARLQRWARSLQTSINKRRVAKRVTDDEQRIEPEDIQQFQESEVYQQAERILEDFQKPSEKVVLEREFVLARNFLVLNIIIDNGQRVGALVNFKLRHLRNAEPQGDCRVCVIAAHKTGQISPVTLVLEDLLWRQVQGFLKGRARLPGYNSSLEEDSAPVFVTFPSRTPSPGPMTTSTMDKAIKSIWKMAGLKKDISGTKMRQGTATSVRGKFPLAKEKLAAQMNHRSATQDSFYILTQRKADAVKVTRAIKTVMRKKDQLTIKDNQPEERGPIIEEIEEEEENVPSISTCREMIPAVQIPSHGRRTFTEGERGVIGALCSDLIANDSTVITNTKVVDRLSRTEEGRAIIHRLEVADPSGWRKRLADRVRTARRRRK